MNNVDLSDGRNRRTSTKNAKELMPEYTAFWFRDPKKAVGICSSCMDRSSCDFVFTFICLVR